MLLIIRYGRVTEMDADGSSKRSRPVRRAVKVVHQFYFLLSMVQRIVEKKVKALTPLPFLSLYPYRNSSSNRKCHRRSQRN